MSSQRRKLDRYEIIAEIASGGMGTVLLARVEGAGGFQRLFAIKMMHPHLVEDVQFVSMLLDEARVAARIHHPNVVATVDICVSTVGHYLVMDYVDGFTLTNILESPRLDPTNRLRITNRILLDVLSGLEAAHNLRADDGAPIGLVHRDVSPHNVLVGLDGVGRLTDFGIALAAARITSSRPGIIKGKPAYMAPEQAHGRVLDRRADLWPIGVILWEAITGLQLFAAESEAATVLNVVSAAVPKPSVVVPDVPPELEAICLRALERDVNRRFRSAREMAADLERTAKRADLLADSHEVADAMREAFATEIEMRRAAIRRHVSMIGPSTAAMTPGDLHQLPKLQQTPVQSAFAPTAQSEEHATVGTPSGGAPAALGGTPMPPTRIAPQASHTDSTTQSLGASRRRGVVFLIVGLLFVVALAVYAVTAGAPEEVEAGTAPDAEIRADDSPDRPAPESSAPSTSAAAVEPTTPMPSTSEEQTATAAPEEEPQTAGSRRRRRRTESEGAESQEAAPGGGAVPVEENPYRHR